MVGFQWCLLGIVRSKNALAGKSHLFTNNYMFQEFAETTEIIATCCLYDINVHVLALVTLKLNVTLTCAC